jgi:hypothetical protein
MNASIFVTSLTAVTILLTGSLGWAADDETYKDKEACEATCKVTKEQEVQCVDEATEAAKKSTAGTSPSMLASACRNSILSECQKKCTGYDSRKDSKTSCEAAVKDWKETAGKSAGACDDFEKPKSGDNTCENRIKSCEKKISDTARLITSSSSGGLDASKGSLDVLLQFYSQKNGIDPKQFNRDGELLETTNCIKWSNDKVDEKREKLETKLEKKDDKIKELKRKIADHEKDIAKENENLRKEIATLDEEKEKIQTTYAENVAKIDVKKREKYTALNKSIQDNIVKIRNMNNAIVKRKEDLEKLRFDYNQSMLQFAEDKISTQCQSAVDTARGCFAKATKGEKFGEKDTCAGFTPTGKGVTGTAVLVKKLTQVRDACFEQAAQASNRARFDQVNKVRTIEQDILEKQNQIKDMNNAANLEKQEFDAITAENEKEKTNETDSKTKKETNLKTKLDGITQSINEKIANSKKQSDILTQEIEELIAEKLPSKLGIVPDAEGNDVKIAFREARKAIEAAELSRTEAYQKCDCDNDTKNQTCVKLKDAATSKANERGRKGVNIRNKR